MRIESLLSWSFIASSSSYCCRRYPLRHAGVSCRCSNRQSQRRWEARRRLGQADGGGETERGGATAAGWNDWHYCALTRSHHRHTEQTRFQEGGRHFLDLSNFRKPKRKTSDYRLLRCSPQNRQGIMPHSNILLAMGPATRLRNSVRICGSLRSISTAFSSNISLFAGCGWLFLDRKSTRLNSSHLGISYALLCYTHYYVTHPFPTRRSSDLDYRLLRCSPQNRQGIMPHSNILLAMGPATRLRNSVRICGSLRSISTAFSSNISLFAGCGWLFFAINSWQEEL